jgi:hypothetical protein
MTAARMQLLASKKVTKGTLRGFATALLPADNLEIIDVPCHVGANGRAWASLPGKAQIDVNGNLARNSAGKIQYLPVNGFHGDSERYRDAFSDRVVELVNQDHPGVPQ